MQIEDNRPPTPEAKEKVLARIEVLARRAGLVPKPAPVIDADFKVIGEGAR